MKEIKIVTYPKAKVGGVLLANLKHRLEDSRVSPKAKVINN